MWTIVQRTFGQVSTSDVPCRGQRTEGEPAYWRSSACRSKLSELAQFATGNVGSEMVKRIVEHPTSNWSGSTATRPRRSAATPARSSELGRWR